MVIGQTNRIAIKSKLERQWQKFPCLLAHSLDHTQRLEDYLLSLRTRIHVEKRRLIERCNKRANLSQYLLGWLQRDYEMFLTALRTINKIDKSPKGLGKRQHSKTTRQQRIPILWRFYRDTRPMNHLFHYYCYYQLFFLTDFFNQLGLKIFLNR